MACCRSSQRTYPGARTAASHSRFPVCEETHTNIVGSNEDTPLRLPLRFKFILDEHNHSDRRR